MTNSEIFEALKENEKQRAIYAKLLKAADEKYPYLCFSEKKLRNHPSYIEGVVTDSKRNQGRINFIDIPDYLGIKELVINRIKEEYQRLQDEFDSYSIQK